MLNGLRGLDGSHGLNGLRGLGELTEPQEQGYALAMEIIHNVEQVVVGKRECVERMLIAFMCGGHVLLEDVPGVGKTTLVKALAKSVGADFKRIQFTPDLLPSDITGVSIYNPRTTEFDFRPGPLMSHIVLADEINRASPRTQAALLESMEEACITVEGRTYRLPEPFFLLATQNPIEYEGTFALPEAQLDRFMLKMKLGYPSPNQETDLLSRPADSNPLDALNPVIAVEEWVRLQRLVAAVRLDDSMKRYIVAITSATRTHPDFKLGASPRASLALFRAAQAQAFLQGRAYAIPDDIKQLAQAVVAHRCMLTMEAGMAGKTAETILKDVLEQTPVPRSRFAAAR